jgi:hypothetical protein
MKKRKFLHTVRTPITCLLELLQLRLQKTIVQHSKMVGQKRITILPELIIDILFLKQTNSPMKIGCHRKQLKRSSKSQLYMEEVLLKELQIK